MVIHNPSAASLLGTNWGRVCPLLRGISSSKHIWGKHCKDVLTYTCLVFPATLHAVQLGPFGVNNTLKQYTVRILLRITQNL